MSPDRKSFPTICAIYLQEDVYKRQDMGGAILSVLFSKFLQMGDDIMLIENEFQMDVGQSFLGRILFLPEICSLDKVLQKAKE